MNYEIVPIDKAPAAARQELERAKRQYGFVPNLMGVLAHAPAALKAYRLVSECFEETSLSPTEKYVVLLAASVKNRCDYCTAAYGVAARAEGVPAEVVDAIQGHHSIADPRLAALRTLTQEIIGSDGWVAQSHIDRFLDAGFTKAQLLEVILGVALKTLSNYTNHLASTPLDPQFTAAGGGPQNAETTSRG